MKKVISVFLALILSFSISITAFATSNESDPNAGNIAGMAESHSTIIGEYKKYTPFIVNNQEVRLYTEPIITAKEALETYAAAFEMCSEKAAIYGISASLDNAEFVSFAKVYAAMNENGTPDLIEECKNFAIYLDYYENIDINQQILNAVSSNARSSDWSDIEALMPSTSHPTVAAGETVYEGEAPAMGTRSTTYNVSVGKR